MTAWPIKATSMLLQVLASSIPPDKRAKGNFGLLARLKIGSSPGVHCYPPEYAWCVGQMLDK